jgi:streptomycin 6-kinase
MDSLPEQFVKRYLSMHGEEGKAWLEGFPNLRDQLREHWSLTDSQPFPQYSYNYLEKARDPSGSQVVLKIGFPDPELGTEILALGHYDGKGAVRLLDGDPVKGALLLERIIPGTDLLTLKEDQAAAGIAGQVMKDLWRPAPRQSPFPSMEKWCRGFNRYEDYFQERPGPLPIALVRQAGGLARELLEEKTEQVLLHGDLHHGNILLGKADRWLIIDPKGVIGERACEVGPLLFNPVPELLQRANLEGIINKRLDILAETTELDRERMIVWSFVRAVLSSIWSVEDRSENLEHGCDFAEILLRLMN